jgi:4-amino-4-deoxy-L-arabinose transferase-like glycosyltransferase
VNPPSPALVTQAAVRRLPRWALILLSLLYVLPGYIGREPWKEADAAAFGLMSGLANGSSEWLSPRFLGLEPDIAGLLPYWVGALFIKVFGALDPEFVVRIPFALMLAAAIASVWYAVYHLAHLPKAQPVVFAFGGQADRRDYARAMGDAALLIFIACLGLAHIGHETAVDVFNVAFTGFILAALAQTTAQTVRLREASEYEAFPKPVVSSLLRPVALGALGLTGLLLSGQPFMALTFALLATLSTPLLVSRRWHAISTDGRRAIMTFGMGWAVLTTAVALALWAFNLPVSYPTELGLAPRLGWYRWLKLVLWFAWPAMPLALWALWQWRRQWLTAHIAVPLSFIAVALVHTVIAADATRTMLLALPPLVVMASFALPTLKRRVTAWIDWFALLFFSGSGVLIWIIWLAIHTGFPAQPAANVARLAPGFEASFSALPTILALIVTGMWIALVRWRTGSVKPAIWKGMVLSAGGSAWCWLLLTTLWLPLLNHGLSYGPLAREVRATLSPTACVNTIGLSQAQLSAVQSHLSVKVVPEQLSNDCDALLVTSDASGNLGDRINLPNWALQARLWQWNNRSQIVYVYQRLKPL